MMKRILILFYVLATFLLTGCLNKTYPPCINQTLGDVVNVELWGVSENDDFLLYTLGPAEIGEFWDAVNDLEFGRYYNDPPTQYGKLYIKIIYYDGYMDILGTDINACYDSNGTSQPVGWFYLINEKDFDVLFSKYVDISVISNAN